MINVGPTLVVTLLLEVRFWNKGELITVLNNKSIKVDCVSPTAQQAQKEGWTSYELVVNGIAYWYKDSDGNYFWSCATS